MIDPEFLQLLRCPETQQTLKLADATLIRSLNERISAGTLKNRGGEQVSLLCDGGLIRHDGGYLYPIRQEIPVMLVAESLPLS